MYILEPFQKSGFFSNRKCKCEIVFAQNKKCLCLTELPQLLFNFEEECTVVAIRIECLALSFGEFFTSSSLILFVQF